MKIPNADCVLVSAGWIVGMDFQSVGIKRLYQALLTRAQRDKERVER
jgi:hypothetical protein